MISSRTCHTSVRSTLPASITTSCCLIRHFVATCPSSCNGFPRRLPSNLIPTACGTRIPSVAAVAEDDNTLRKLVAATASQPAQLLKLLESVRLDELMAAASCVRDAAFPQGITTFSPKVFIPLTRLCRDSCGYCTFAQPPQSGRRAYMTIEEVLEVAAAGVALGCYEALFTLGDKPELRYPEASAELKAMGFTSTIEYVAAAASAVLKQTGLLPHINAGVMDAADLRMLRQVSVSQGLMLETLSSVLLEPGKAHYDCPDKEPGARLMALELAGQERIPFTTGVLVGIGESRLERIEALLAIQASHNRHGHIQEVIVQNFRAKKGTAMAAAHEPSLSELLWTTAVARLILDPAISLQAPPNLSPEPDDVAVSDTTNAVAENTRKNSWRRLIEAGINDFGGISPLTRDYVNPERPWPQLGELALATADAGNILIPRLPVYPTYLNAHWVDSSGGVNSPLAAALRSADCHGLARSSGWYAGAVNGNVDVTDGNDDISGCNTSIDSGSYTDGSALDATRPAIGTVSPAQRRQAWKVATGKNGCLVGTAVPVEPREDIAALLAAVLAPEGYELSADDIVRLFSARGADFDAVVGAADELRSRINGNTATYVVNRNINYTNVCTYACRFCAFSKGKSEETLRGSPYLLSYDEVSQRTAEAWQRGATEVCMQGGIHPDFTGDTYLKLLAAAKAGAPDIHVHAFSPLEVMQGAATLGWSVQRFLAALRDAGLGSLPGTAAEVLDDAVRFMLCPDKLSTAEWLKVVETAHEVGLKTTSTIMFGHVDGPAAWATHLVALRSLQRRTGGLTEFVPLPFVHMEAPIYRKGLSRAGPTFRECVLMHAIGRLALHPYVKNIQASWVKMGPQHAAALLSAGCNDMGGTLMNESITRAAGAAHGQELGPVEMERLIKAAGRVPLQRTVVYERAPCECVEASFL